MIWNQIDKKMNTLFRCNSDSGAGFGNQVSIFLGFLWFRNPHLTFYAKTAKCLTVQFCHKIANLDTENINSENLEKLPVLARYKKSNSVNGTILWMFTSFLDLMCIIREEPRSQSIFLDIGCMYLDLKGLCHEMNNFFLRPHKSNQYVLYMRR
jgi:hypothetical protein